jgi:hypothetical protein
MLREGVGAGIYRLEYQFWTYGVGRPALPGSLLPSASVAWLPVSSGTFWSSFRRG